MFRPILNITIWAFCRLLFTDQVFYKDDLNWMKGIGCYVWDTPEIIRAKKSYDLQSDVSNNTSFIVALKIFVCYFFTL